MRKNFLWLIIMLTTISLSAQKMSPMRAYSLFYEQNYVKAKECIDACVQDEKYGAKANTWLYKANIDYRLAGQEYSAKQKDTSYHIQYPNTPREAYLAFQKALSINKNVEASDMYSPAEALPKLYPILFIQGVNELIANNFEEANQILALSVESYEMQTPEYPLNGELYYYYAYSFEMLNNAKQAETYYQKAIDDGSENINVFIRLIENYKNENRPQEVLALIEKAKAKNPNNSLILIAEADYYYWINDAAKGRELLKQIPSLPSPEAIVNVANLYIKDENYEEAERLLKKAYQQNSNNYIVANNLGVCCDNIGNNQYLEANKLDIAGKKEEARRMKESAENYLNQAATYFEKAYALNPSDTKLILKLKEIYLRLQQNEKAAALEKNKNQ